MRRDVRVITGVFKMSQAEAQSYIDTGGRVEIRLWGDDPSSDDLLIGPVRPNYLTATANGLAFGYWSTPLTSTLNEDSG